MPATYDDANLVMKLLTWGATMNLQEAIGKIFQARFDPETADFNDGQIQTILNFGETVGTFVKQGVLDRGLVEDLWWFEGIWARVGGAALRQRDLLGEARIFENFEALAAH